MSRTALRPWPDTRAGTPAEDPTGFPTVRGTLALVCGMPRQPDPRLLEDWSRRASESGVPVTWAVALEDFSSIGPALAERHGDRSVALLVSADVWKAFRGPSTMRRHIDVARRAVPGFDSLVVDSVEDAASGCLAPLLVANGIKAVCSPVGAIAGSRSSRRPAPRGWACRSPAWGLWEFRFDEPRRTGFLGGLMRFAGHSGIADRGLTVAATGMLARERRRGETGRSLTQRQGRHDLDKTLSWASRLRHCQSARFVVANLSDVSARLSGCDSLERRSVAA